MLTIRKWRKANLDALESCPDCGEPFHVHATLVERREAGRFLWWRWGVEPAYWDARCGMCGRRYRVAAELAP